MRHFQRFMLSFGLLALCALGFPALAQADGEEAALRFYPYAGELTVGEPVTLELRVFTDDAEVDAADLKFSYSGVAITLADGDDTRAGTNLAAGEAFEYQQGNLINPDTQMTSLTAYNTTAPLNTAAGYAVVASFTFTPEAAGELSFNWDWQTPGLTTDSNLAAAVSSNDILAAVRDAHFTVVVASEEPPIEEEPEPPTDPEPETPDNGDTPDPETPTDPDGETPSETGGSGEQDGEQDQSGAAQTPATVTTVSDPTDAIEDDPTATDSEDTSSADSDNPALTEPGVISPEDQPVGVEPGGDYAAPPIRLDDPAVVTTEELSVARQLAFPVAVAGSALAFVAAVPWWQLLGWHDLLLWLKRLLDALLVLVGVKRRVKPWGVVFDAQTKRPLDPVYVSLHDLSGRQIADQITDMDGRFGFLVSPGRYRIQVLKSNYAFPSQQLVGKHKHGGYDRLYFGGTLRVRKYEDIVRVNIPLDPVGEDWNEQEKIRMFGSHPLRDLWLQRLATWSVSLALVWSLLLSLWAFQPTDLFWLAWLGPLTFWQWQRSAQVRAGRLLDAGTGEPLPGVRIALAKPDQEDRVIKTLTTDAQGRYYTLLHRGTDFRVTFTGQRADGTPFELTQQIDFGRKVANRELRV